MPFNKMLILAGKWDTTPLVYNYLAKDHAISKVIIEEPVPRKTFLKKRAKKLGWLNVAGQVVFQLLIGKPMQKLSSGRIKEIQNLYGLNNAAIPAAKMQEVDSINNEQVIIVLKQLQPDIVIVHGTRIISQKVLNSTSAIFLNIHAGVTPKYRGSHGGYWAIANNDKENCGVTVHVVDKGIDTGGILGQRLIPVTNKDNFATYPYLQLGEGLLLLNEILTQLERGERKEIKNNLASGLWHHPTLWGYVWKRLLKGVK